MNMEQQTEFALGFTSSAPFCMPPKRNKEEIIMAIDNRYEFLFYISAATAIPTGTDMATRPGWTLRTSMATSRTWPSSPHPQLCPGRLCREARHGNADPQRQQHQHRNCPGQGAGPGGLCQGRNEVYAGRAACQLFYDVRTFGAVMSTAPTPGRSGTGPADLCPVSGSPIQPQDEFPSRGWPRQRR